MNCTDCGAQVFESWSYCSACGAEVVGAQPPPLPDRAPDPATPESPPRGLLERIPFLGIGAALTLVAAAFMADRVNNPPTDPAPGQWERIDGWIAECDTETARRGELTEDDFQRLARKHGLTHSDMEVLERRTLDKARASVRRGR